MAERGNTPRAAYAAAFDVQGHTRRIQCLMIIPSVRRNIPYVTNVTYTRGEVWMFSYASLNGLYLGVTDRLNSRRIWTLIKH